MFTKILVPVDLIEPHFAERAIDAILDYAKAGNALVRLMTVRQIVPQMVGEYLPPDFEKGADEETLAELKAFAGKIALPPEKVSIVVRVGSVYHEILDEAKAYGADLIVVGSHRPSMATYLLGSNAGNIVRHAPCSVLVVR